MNTAPPSPKGFRDIGPDLAQKRRLAINKIVAVLKEFGFVPIETPTIEFAQTLTGKYGEEERLIYKFTDRGGRELALRYDLTVPLARYIASNQELIAKGPFRRYQIGQVFRGENPQHGRYREFTQFDFDTVGSNDLEEDARVIACALKAAHALGIVDAVMLVNDRKSFENIPMDFVRALDKLHKIGEDGIRQELTEKGHKKDEIEDFLENFKVRKPTDSVSKLIAKVQGHGIDSTHLLFDPTLARGLDYYTGAIFEMKPSTNPSALSIGSGGRYDNLIGMFAKKQIPAVGFSFGIDRTIEALE